MLGSAGTHARCKEPYSLIGWTAHCRGVTQLIPSLRPSAETLCSPARRSCIPGPCHCSPGLPKRLQRMQTQPCEPSCLVSRQHQTCRQSFHQVCGKAETRMITVHLPYFSTVALAICCLLQQSPGHGRKACLVAVQVFRQIRTSCEPLVLQARLPSPWAQLAIPDRRREDLF